MQLTHSAHQLIAALSLVSINPLQVAVYHHSSVQLVRLIKQNLMLQKSTCCIFAFRNCYLRLYIAHKVDNILDNIYKAILKEHSNDTFPFVFDTRYTNVQQDQFPRTQLFLKYCTE